jgi:hypothetical protein
MKRRLRRVSKRSQNFLGNAETPRERGKADASREVISCCPSPVACRLLPVACLSERSERLCQPGSFFCRSDDSTTDTRNTMAPTIAIAVPMLNT